MVESEVPPKPPTTNERPSTVRRRNTELHARVNGNLAFEFTDAKLTSYAGLELFDRYLRQMGFSELVRAAFAERQARSQADLARLFRSAGIDAIQLRTDRPYAVGLARFFETRERRRLHG